MHFNTCKDGAYLHSHTSKWEKYTYQIFADKCDEDTWGMEERQEGAEERRELTGTSFQYQRVGHCQKKGKRKGNRKTAKWRLGGQHNHWYHKGGSLPLRNGQKYQRSRRSWKRIIKSEGSWKLSYRCWDVWLGMIQTILFMGKLTCLHEHEWWGFNEPLKNIITVITVMRTNVLWESKV